MEHRSSTRMCHLSLFCAVPFASFQVRCFLCNSAILVRRQVCWGLPFFKFPYGFHSSALLTTCSSGLLNVWPIRLQALCLIYWLLHSLSPKLLVVNFSRPPNLQDVPQALIAEHLQLLLFDKSWFYCPYVIDLQLCKFNCQYREWRNSSVNI